ncbi:MAG: hypothetical protein V4568_16465 [Pseudomonadota bacterium]
MGDTKMTMTTINPEIATQQQSELVSWGDWWEQWGDEVFDAPAKLLDFESVCSKE